MQSQTTPRKSKKHNYRIYHHNRGKKYRNYHPVRTNRANDQKRNR